MVTNSSTATAGANNSPVELPPHSLEAEQAVLGSCLIDREVIAVVGPSLSAEDFYYPANQQVYWAIVRLWNRRVPADLIPVIEELKAMPRIAGMTPLDYVGGESYVSELIVNTPTAVHANYYAEIVKRYAHRRRVLELGQKIARDAYDPALSEDDRISRATDALRAMPTGEHRSLSMADLMNQWQDEPDGFRAPGIETGLSRYDRVTGGLRPGQLVVIGARTGIGKSAIAGQWAFNVASAGHPVGFLSLEMRSEDIAKRMVGQVVDIDMAKVETDVAYYRKHLQTITDARARLHLLPIHYNQDMRGDLPSVLGAITRERQTHNIEVVFVDYLGQIVNPAARAGNRAIELGSVTRGLKLAALDMGICIVLLAQLNRELEGRGEDAKPRLSDLRDSGSTEQDADVVLLLHRSKTEESDTLFRLAKNRAGATGDFWMHFIHHRTTFVAPAGTP